MNSQEKLASRRLGLEKRVSSPSFSVEISLFASAVGASLPMTRIGWETPRKEKRRDLCLRATPGNIFARFRARARHNGVLRNAAREKKKRKNVCIVRAEVNNDIKRGTAYENGG